MKIHVFTVTEESYHYGDRDNLDKKLFKTEELQNEYYNHLIKYYRDTLQLVDHGNGDFSDNYSWAYHVESGEEDLEIIEENIWN